jgi:lysophospholipase L1-like esterase
VNELSCDAGCRLRRQLAVGGCAAGGAGLVGYAAIAAWFGEAWAGAWAIDAPGLVALVLLVFALLLWGLAGLAKRGQLAWEWINGLALALPVTLAGLLALDGLYAAYIERSAPPPPLDDRHFDSHYAAGEFYPPLYYPTPRNFRLHRPGIHVSMAHYGDYFSTQLLQSETLRREVLALRQVAIAIDEHGLRESRPIDGAQIAALGDSFTFGWGMNEEQTWVRQLERRLGQRVVNLGVHDGSPRQQLELLKYMLEQQGERLPLKQVVWLLYEGNDLEDSYAADAPAPQRPPWQRGFAPLLHGLFSSLKDNMVVEQFRRGRVQLAGAANQLANRHLQVDGVPLDVPLYRSAQLGSALFLSTFIERGAQPQRYVLRHENRPLLDKTFEEMAQLAKARGFRVVVAMAPTAARLHGHYFEDFPPLSERPYFIDYVGTLAQKHGMPFLNLLDLFAERAAVEFLHQRDDDHWNEKGHALATEMIARYGFDRLPAMAQGKF